MCKPFYLDDRKLVVDIVCDNGLTWLKVVARNPKSLSQVSMGDASFGVRSVVDQAQEFVDCAKLYPHMFQTPTVGLKINYNFRDFLIIIFAQFLGDFCIYKRH